MIVESDYPPVYIPENINVADYVLSLCSLHGNRTAYINATAKATCTFADVVRWSNRVAGALHARGLKQGDTVCLLSKNDIHYMPALLGIIKTAGVVTTCNPLNTTDELLTQLEDCKPIFLIAAPECADTVRKAQEKYTALKECFVFGDSVPGFTAFHELINYDGPDAPHAEVCSKTDSCALMYSSGTTGKPKGVILTHYNVLAQPLQILQTDLTPLKQGDVWIFIPPFFHIYGVVFSLTSLLIGATLVIFNRFDFELFLKSIQEYKGTKLAVVPPILVVMCKHPLVKQYDLSTVRNILVGAAATRKETEEAILKLIPSSIITQAYGLTELSGACHLKPVGSPFGTIGRLVASNFAKVVDLETGKVLKAGESGEILIRGPTVMKGYLNRPDATNATIDEEGWLRTGDIGYFDEQGYWFVVDRLKELIKYKGFQVAPADLESLLLTHEGVDDVAVIGLPDLEAGELPRAYVVKKPNQVVTEDDIVKFVYDRVAPHKRIRGGVEFIDAIPKSASGKILRRVIKEKLNTK